MERVAFLARRWFLAVAILAGFALALPSLGLGFCIDDQGFRAVLEHSGRSRLAYDLFRFAPDTPGAHEYMVTRGLLPWWAAPDLKLHFIRPLTSLLFALDDELFGANPLGYHVDSLLWTAFLLVAAAAFFRRVLPPVPAALALLVFALRAAHVQPIDYISARHVLVAAAAVALGLALLARGRPVLAALAFVVGLLGSEAGLAGPIFWASAALFGPRRRREVLAPVALVAVYLVAYHLVGGGARASGAYHDPLADPLGFAGVAAVRVPALLADALLGVPAELALGGSEVTLAAVGLGAALLVGFLLFCARPDDEERAALRWLVPGALGALVIGCTGLPGGRVLMLPDFGFAALLGVLLHHGFAATGRARVARAAGTALLVLQHVVVAPVANVLSLARLGRIARGIDRVAATAEIDAPPARHVFIVGASDPAVYLYPRGVLAWDEPRRARCFLPLSGARSSHRLTRPMCGDEKTISLEALDRPLLDGSFDQLFRAPDRPLAPGDTCARAAPPSASSTSTKAARAASRSTSAPTPSSYSGRTAASSACHSRPPARASSSPGSRARARVF